MTEITRILNQVESGDPSAAENLLPLVYDELRQLARAWFSAEKEGQTLQPTALVHEAYLRLVDEDCEIRWDSRGHFFVAAATAMRRILIENARRKGRLKYGNGLATQIFYRPQFCRDCRLACTFRTNGETILAFCPRLAS